MLEGKNKPIRLEASNSISCSTNINDHLEGVCTLMYIFVCVCVCVYITLTYIIHNIRVSTT